MSNESETFEVTHKHAFTLSEDTYPFGSTVQIFVSPEAMALLEKMKKDIDESLYENEFLK